MSKGPIRRGQLIAPFGVGALVIVKDGTSVISAGLDNWYLPEGGKSAGQDLDVDEYKIEEWRLQKLLGVNHFRLPPDFRRKQRGQQVPNTGLTVPFLRFPTWHFCPFCKTLNQLFLSAKGTVLCQPCLGHQKRNYLVQVPFITICDHGHVNDFPWREWVHGTASPVCDNSMKLIATGGASLSDQKVTCGCGRQRSLSGITTAAPDGNSSFLSQNLDRAGGQYSCGGQKPWLGIQTAEGCGRPLRGSLRSASNVYFARVFSAIYLPKASQGAPDELISLFKAPPFSTLINLLRTAGANITAQALRQQHRETLKPYSDGDIDRAIEATNESSSQAVSTEQAPLINEASETAFRRTEFEVLKNRQSQQELMTNPESINNYSGGLSNYFSDITLVYKLRETRVLTGFSRVFPDDGLTVEKHIEMLRKEPIAPNESWLPANVVYGEGIFLQLAENKLRNWEQNAETVALVNQLSARYMGVQKARKLKDLTLSPRFVLLHTLSHLLINKLTFECGYGSSSLRERLYISNDAASPMAGLLIYTAAGDSEGTMGGLVRMGKPGYLEPVIQKAIRDAEWCSTDPVCMEIGHSHGQGPDGCNGAACHNCALVPETACEQFNRFLDRALVVGTRENRSLGFFHDLFSVPS